MHSAGGRTTSLIALRAPALCVLAVIGAACGGVVRSANPTTTTRPVASASLKQVVRAGQLVFSLPSSWAVGYGTCRCGWGEPDTATLDNGPQGGGVVCNCPAEGATAPSGLHLYVGSTGLIPGGKPAVINGLQASVSLDTSTATMTATFPGVDQWITISPAPASGSLSTQRRQVALETQILATVKMNPASDGVP
jgi:hypothetical protein